MSIPSNTLGIYIVGVSFDVQYRNSLQCRHRINLFPKLGREVAEVGNEFLNADIVITLVLFLNFGCEYLIEFFWHYAAFKHYTNHLNVPIIEEVLVLTKPKLETCACPTTGYMRTLAMRSFRLNSISAKKQTTNFFCKISKKYYIENSKTRGHTVPPHLDLHCLQIYLLSSLTLKGACLYFNVSRQFYKVRQLL